jgi:hypothetical protein
MEYLKSKKVQTIILIVVSSIIILVILYGAFFHNRTKRCIKNINLKFKKILHIQSLSRNKKIMKGNYKLSDFYIASSNKSYLTCTNYYDYISTDALKNCLENGCRFIDLDIYNSDLTKESWPVVAYGKERGNWKYTNSLCFEECCKVISNLAFSNLILNNSDPLFINLNLYLNKNLYTVDKVAENIYKYFSFRMLPPQFSYQGISHNHQTTVNISETPIKDLFNKVIFICDQYELFKDSKLDEIINISNSIGNYKNISNDELFVNDCKCNDDVTDTLTDLKDFNKKYLTKFYTPIKSRHQKNIDYKKAWYLGCQFICMNYNSPDKNMLNYLKEFNEYSFILKPYKLRVKNTLNTGELVKTPYYSIRY